MTEINFLNGNILEINYLSKIMVRSIIFSVALVTFKITILLF